jgi:hypothetical protein
MTNLDPPHNQPRKDPFLDGVHALKRAAFARSGDNLDKHIERLREIERQYADRLVQPPNNSETNAL